MHLINYLDKEQLKLLESINITITDKDYTNNELKKIWHEVIDSNVCMDLEDFFII